MGGGVASVAAVGVGGVAVGLDVGGVGALESGRAGSELDRSVQDDVRHTRSE